MHLETDNHSIDNVQADQLREILAGLTADQNNRAILSIDDEDYIQTAAYNNGFVIEKREGSEDQHFHAVPEHAPLLPAKMEDKRGWLAKLLLPDAQLTHDHAFAQADMIEIFDAHLQGREPNVNLIWEPGTSA